MNALYNFLIHVLDFKTKIILSEKNEFKVHVYLGNLYLYLYLAKCKADETFIFFQEGGCNELTSTMKLETKS